jgi:hypothetical protein
MGRFRGNSCLRGSARPPFVAVPTIADVRVEAESNFPVHVTRGHEAEAREAQLRKPPSRFGTWILRRLGFRGEIQPHLPPAQTQPSHERSVPRPTE